MIKCKIATRVVKKIPLMGLIHPTTFEENLPFEYFFIKEIKNYFDLSFKKYDTVYLLFETNDDYWNGKSKFCMVSETSTFISSNKYTDLNFFYKGESICNLDEKVHIINLNEELLRGPLDDLWDIEPDIEENFSELFRFSEDVRKNYSFHKSRTKNIMSFDSDTFPVKEEIDLGLSQYFDGIYDKKYDYLGDFNDDGICIFKNKGKFGFINRYAFIIAYGFEYVYSNEELFKIGIINHDGLIQYVSKDNQILKIQFEGNFVNEITNHPSLFLPNDFVDHFFPTRFMIGNNDFSNRIYFRLDEIITDLNEASDVTSVAEISLTDFQYFFPFYLTQSQYDKVDVDELILKHNNLFGLIPSCYTVLDKVLDVISIKQYNLIPYRDGEKYGYKNQFQELIVPCIYDFAEPIINGFGAVRLEDKWGGINGKYTNSYDSKFGYGDLMINCIYDSLGDFSEGLISVKKDDKWGFLDWESNIIVPHKYDSVKPFSNGFATVILDNKASFIDKKGKLIIPLQYEDVDLFKNGFAGVFLAGQFGVINTLGEEVTMMHFEQPVVYSEGLFMVKLDNKVGFIDETCDWAVENKYDIASPFSEGLAVVKINNKLGYVDKKGNVIIPIEYSEAYDFKMGIARVYKDGKYGFINPRGETIIPFIFSDADCFNNGFARVCCFYPNYSGYGIIDTEGNIILPFDFDDIDRKCFSEGLVSVSCLGDYGYIDTQANFISERIYLDSYPFRDGIALVRKRGGPSLGAKKHSFFDGGVEDVNGNEINEFDFFPDLIVHKCHGYIDKFGNEYWND